MTPHWRSTLQVCAKAYGVCPDELMRPGRTRPVTAARSVVWYVMHRRDGKGYGEIGRLFGGMDHSSVGVGIRRVVAMIERGDVKITALVDAEMARREPVEAKWKRRAGSIDPAAFKARYAPKNDPSPGDNDALSRLRGSAALIARLREMHPERCAT